MFGSVAGSYLIYILVFVALLLILGIPAILSRVKLPADFSWKELSESELSPEAKDFFQKLDPKAQALYFRPFKNFTVPGLPQENQHRIYLNPDNTTGLLATVIFANNRATPVLEFSTHFQDDTEIDTGNAPVSLLFDEPSWRKMKRYPGVYDLAQLYNYHQSQVQEKMTLGIGPKPVAEERVMEEIQKSQIRQMDYQVERGILKKDEAEGVYRPTPKIALRGVQKFLNPFADDFNLIRFLIGAGGGLILTIAWALLVENFALEEILKNYLGALPEPKIQFLLYSPGFILAGLLVGWQFPEKGFLWGFLISIPAIYLMPETLPYPLYLSLLSAQSGSVTNRLQSRQELKKLISALGFLFLLILGYYLWVR